MVQIAVVFHSEKGHTRVVAEAVAQGVDDVEGAQATLMAVATVDWPLLAACDAIIFGCPTFMGSVSAAFKAFMEASSSRAWAGQAWKDKLAAGFTNSAGHSGDKLNTLVQLAVFAAQHGMLWIGLGLPPGNNSSRGSRDDLNRLASFLGAMAQSNVDEDPSTAPPRSDRRTAHALGERVAGAALRWAGAARSDKPPPPSAAASPRRHPTTAHWRFPPAERPRLPGRFRRCNLRTLLARPQRFEHHLLVVAQVGSAQLEAITASEPLYFAHANISDEYSLNLETGDPLLGALRFLTLLSDPDGTDAGRIRSGLGDLVLHPQGLLHWPGRLRAPWQPFAFGPGMRRCGLSIVVCADQPTPAAYDRPLFVTAGREADVKSYRGPPPPFLLAATSAEGPRLLGRIGTTRLELLVAPQQVAPACGGYLLVLAGEEPHFPGDLVYLPPGVVLPGQGLGRCLLLSSPTTPPTPPPASWIRLPEPPFAVYESAAAGRLPVGCGDLQLQAVDGQHVRALLGKQGCSAPIPRYWLARMLFRIALHGGRLGYLETYGGLCYDDRGGVRRLGVRGLGEVELPAETWLQSIAEIYRAVAPEGYRERLE